MVEVMLIPLHSLLSSGRNNDHPVCHDGQRFVRWREFSRQIVAQTEVLKKRNESRWLLTTGDPQIFAVNLMALLHAGKQVVIPPNSQAGTLAQLENAFDAIIDTKIPALETSFIVPPPLDPQTAIIDVYTSGSAGKPKQVRKTLMQFEVEIDALEELWGATIGRATIVASAPHQHIYGLIFRLLWPLAAGRAFDSVTCARPDILGERLAMLGQSGDTLYVSSPAQLSRLPALTQLDTLRPPPKMIFSSGGPLPRSTAAEFHRHFGHAPTEVFGSTETGGIAWRRQEDMDDGDTWTPLPGVHVGCDEDGALSLRSPFLHNNTPWRMEDAIELRPDGRFRLSGRLDRTVKIEEKRLSLPDMETQLGTHPWVHGTATVALSGQRQSVGAVVVLTIEGRQQLETYGKQIIVQQLRRHLTEHFETVLLPRRWRFPTQLPMNDRGKLTHAALTAMFTSDERLSAVSTVLRPDILAVRREGNAGDQVAIDLRVPAELAHFPGHFPGLHILPGVVQVDWAIRYAHEHLALSGHFKALENIKFLALVLPNTLLNLNLKWETENARLEFCFATGQRKCSSGRVVFSGDT